jgi:hypothetical protein
VATAIRIGRPQSWELAWAASRESGGSFSSLTDEEILAAQRLLAEREGIFCEPASAIALGGALRDIASGKIAAGSLITCTLTGHGLKDPDTAIRQSGAVIEVPAESAGGQTRDTRQALRVSRLDILAPDLLDGLIQGYAGSDPAAVRVARTLARATFEPVPMPASKRRCWHCSSAATHRRWPASRPPMISISRTCRVMWCALTRFICAPILPASSCSTPTAWVWTRSEADSLLAHLNAVLAGEALEFKRGRSPLRWYATGLDVASLALASPRALRGQAIESCLDELRKSGPLNRLVTEAQMLLYEAPVNVARESSGRAPLNSIWFWGAGPAPVLAASTLDVIIGDDDLVAACARHAGITHHRDSSELEAALAAGATVRWSRRTPAMVTTWPPSNNSCCCLRSPIYDASV